MNTQQIQPQKNSKMELEYIIQNQAMMSQSQRTKNALKLTRKNFSLSKNSFKSQDGLTTKAGISLQAKLWDNFELTIQYLVLQEPLLTNICIISQALKIMVILTLVFYNPSSLLETDNGTTQLGTAVSRAKLTREIELK